MAENTEWIALGRVIGDTGPKGDTGVGTTIKGSYDTLEELIAEHPMGNDTDAYLVDDSFYFWNGNQWENAGSIKGETGATGPAGPKGDKGDKGDTGEKGNKGDKGETGATGEKGEPGLKGDTGDTGPDGDTGPAGPIGDTGATGAGLTIKGSYNSYEELIDAHPQGSDGDSYLVNGSLYVWNGNAWENVGNIKGDTGDVGPKGDTGAKGDTGVKGDTGDAFTFEDFTPEQLAGLKGPKGDTGDTGKTGSKGDTGVSGFSPTVNVNHEDREITITSEEGSVTISFDELKGDTGATGQGSDEEAGWKLPVDEILTTTTLPTGVSAGYRVAIVTSSVMVIKEYDGSSWKTESLDAYSVIPLKHSGGIQMYLAKSSGPVYMGVEYGVFGKFRFMTQSAYDALSSYDSDTIYFVRSS